MYPACSEGRQKLPPLQFILTYNRAHDIQVSLKDFEVYCTYRKLGCEWKGKLEMLDKHLNVDPEPEKQLEGCAFVEVQCCHDGCGQSLQRRLIAQHQEEECDQRPFSYDYCHDYNSTWYDVVANHFPVCKCYPVPCPNYCTPYTIECQHLERHLNEDCPLQEVKCEFKYGGCETKLPRKDMPEHLKENVGHMTLLARQNQELTAKNQELSAKLLVKEETIKRMVEENRREIEKAKRLALSQQQSSERLVHQLQEAMEENRREIGRELEEQVKEKVEKIENLAKEYQQDEDRLEREKNEQIRRLEQEMRQRMEETREEGRVGLDQLKGRIVELQKKTETDISKVKGEIDKTETRRAQLMTETQRQITELERSSQATGVEVKGLKDESKRIEDHILAVEKSVITEAEREKLAQQVATKRELELRVRELARKQDITKREIEERVGGLGRQQDAAKADLDKQMGGLGQKQDVTTRSLERLHRLVQITPLHPTTAPVQMVITNFDQRKRENDWWYSEGFYTHPKGYKICLRVFANGSGRGEGTHVSLYIFLMRGEFDDHLKWPFRRIVTIQLLNQQEDNNHHTQTFPFDDMTPAECTARVTNGDRSENGRGYSQFVLHSELGRDAVTNCQYLMNNCLYFRVKVELR